MGGGLAICCACSGGGAFAVSEGMRISDSSFSHSSSRYSEDLSESPSMPPTYTLFPWVLSSELLRGAIILFFSLFGWDREEDANALLLRLFRPFNGWDEREICVSVQHRTTSTRAGMGGGGCEPFLTYLAWKFSAA